MKIIGRTRAFTLVELLVVISIISLLASIVLSALNSARVKARDSQRIQQMRQIQIALDLYYDANGRYPSIGSGTAIMSTDPEWSSVLGAAISAYLPIPIDPINDSTYHYFYDADAGDNYQTYGLMAAMESTSNFSKVANDGGYYNLITGSDAGKYYEVGRQPVYCMGKYNDSRGRWWNIDSAVCAPGYN